MDKIKKVLSPGSSKDDEVLYGSEESRRKESHTNNSTSPQPSKLHSVGDAGGKKESGGVLSQITNPDVHRYEEQRFEPTASTVGTGRGQETRGIGEKLYPGHSAEENNTHYPGLGDAEAAGSVDPNARLETDDDKKKDHSILRQIFNPSGKKRDDVAYGTTAHATSEKVPVAMHMPETARSDHVGGTLGGTGVAAAGVSTTLADRGVTIGTGTTSTDRGAASEHSQTGIVGATGRSEAGVASTGIDRAPKYNEPQSHVLDRSHPLRDGSGAAAGHINPVGAPEAGVGRSNHASQSESIGVLGGATAVVNDTTGRPDSHINPVGAPSTANATLSVPAAGLASSTAGATAFTESSSSQRQTQPKVTELDTSRAGATSDDRSGVPSGSERPHHPEGTELDCDGNPVIGYVHHVNGPHSTDIANQLDPRVSGASTDRKVVSGGAMTGSSAVGSDGLLQSHASAGLATGNVGQVSRDPMSEDHSTSHGGDDREKKGKTGLLQKILHPRSHKEERDSTHEHPLTAVDNHGRNVLHKDPPSH